MSLAQILLKQNNAFGTTSAIMTNLQTSIVLITGHTMPIVPGNFYAIIWDINTFETPFLDPNVEIVLMNYSGTVNTYTIVRGQENTSAASHPINSQIAMTFTAATATNDLSILGTHVFDESNIGPEYFVWFNAATNNYELHAGTTGSSELPFGLYSNIPASPTAGQMYLAVDTKVLYACYTNGVWTTLTANHGNQLFLTSGTFTPNFTGTVYLTGCGGGAGGNTNANSGSCGGNAGQWVIKYPFAVTSGTPYTVTIATAVSAYTNGNSTSFGTMTLLGGTRPTDSNAGNPGTIVGGYDALTTTPGSFAGKGGQGGKTTGGGPGQGAAGGGTPFGVGATAPSGSPYTGVNGTPNTGVGGSGGDSDSGGNQGTGGGGASGFLLVEW